ncbi:MAG: ATP-binding protein [Anaerolineaceae bacterium]|nr:ATP-binding protein [Anaerolineaceae bacterium]
MRNSILFRIAGPYVILILFILSGLGIYLTNVFKNTYQESLIQHLTVDAKITADQARYLLSNSDEIQQVRDLVNKNAEIMNARITIIDFDGKVLADSEKDSKNLENHGDRPEFINAINNGFGTDIRKSQSVNEDSLYVAIPIFDDEENILAISRISVSISVIDDQIQKFQRLIFGMTLLTALIAIILAILITKKTLDPLKKLNIAINKMEIGINQFDIPQNQQDEIGKISQYIWQLTTRLNRQNEDFKLERKTLNAVLNQMTDAVIIVDGEGFIQLSNPSAERMFNFKKEEIKEKTIVEVIRNYQLFEIWKNCHEDRIQREMTIEINPNKIFVQAIVKPLDEIFSGGVLMVIQDLTRVRQLEKIRSDFISNVSHELRTPIASIKALSDTLQEGALDDPPAARRFISRMDVEIDNLTQLVQELLELSKIESGRVPLKKTICNPKILIEKAIDRMQVQAERSGLLLSSIIPDRLSDVHADPDRIGQVFVNLMHNAIKFTPPGGSIVVSAKEGQNEVVFSIQDTGVGIESESLNRIFERFYKTDRARASGGTGLGLSITKHIIEAHSGRVWVDSIVGSGSTFYFSLPTG